MPVYEEDVDGYVNVYLHHVDLHECRHGVHIVCGGCRYVGVCMFITLSVSAQVLMFI